MPLIQAWKAEKRGRQAPGLLGLYSESASEEGTGGREGRGERVQTVQEVRTAHSSCPLKL